jgi:hypothetical protein
MKAKVKEQWNEIWTFFLNGGMKRLSTYHTYINVRMYIELSSQLDQCFSTFFKRHILKKLATSVKYPINFQVLADFVNKKLNVSFMIYNYKKVAIPRLRTTERD